MGSLSASSHSHRIEQTNQEQWLYARVMLNTHEHRTRRYHTMKSRKGSRVEATKARKPCTYSKLYTRAQSKSIQDLAQLTPRVSSHTTSRCFLPTSQASQTSNATRPKYHHLHTQTTPHTPCKRSPTDNTTYSPYPCHTSPPNAARSLSCSSSAASTNPAHMITISSHPPDTSSS